MAWTEGLDSSDSKRGPLTVSRKTVTNFLGPIKAVNVLTSCVNISFSRKNLLHVFK